MNQYCVVTLNWELRRTLDDDKVKIARDMLEENITLLMAENGRTREEAIKIMDCMIVPVEEYLKKKEKGSKNQK